MKLHLPKQLFTALLAAITLAAPAALTVGSVSSAITLSENTEVTVNGTTYNATIVSGADNQGMNMGANITLAEGSDIIAFSLYNNKTGTDSGTNWFNDTQTYAQNILIYDDDLGDAVEKGLIINNGGGYDVITFAGNVYGNGAIHKTSEAPSNGMTFKFTGDMSAFTGDIILDGNSNDKLIITGSTTGTGIIESTGAITFNGATVYNSEVTTTSALNIGVDGEHSITTIGRLEDLENNISAIAPTVNVGTATISSGASLNILNGSLTSTGSFTNNGELTVAGSGVLTITGDFTNNGSFAVGAGATASINSSLALSSTIVNNGTLYLNGAISASSADVFTLAATGVGQNTAGHGFYENISYAVVAGSGSVNMGEGVHLTLGSGDSVTTPTLQEGSAGNVYFDTTADANTYYVFADTTAGDVVTAVENKQAENAVFTLSAIHVNSGATLTSTGANFSNVSLKGNGIYDAGATKSMTSGLTVDPTWRGTVKIYDSTNNADVLINTLGVTGSTVDISNVNGYFQSGSSSANHAIISPHINLSGALTITDGYGGSFYEFHGKVSGTGNLNFQRSGGPVNTFYFKNDISGWTGTLNHTAQTDNIYLQGYAHDINAAFNRTGGTLDLYVETNTAATFRNAVSVSNLTLNQSATFSNALTVTNATTIAAGKTLTVDGNITANMDGTLTNNGNLEVTNGGILSINSTIRNAGTLTIADGSKLQINSLSGYNYTKSDDYTLNGTDGTYGYQEGRIWTYDIVTGTGSITLNGSVMLGEEDITSSVTNGQYNVDQNEKVYEITGAYTGPVIEYNGSSGETKDADTFIVHEGASLKITDTVNSNGLLGKNVSGAGTLIIAAAANDSVAFTSSYLADFTGTVDVTSGQLYVGQYNNADSQGAAVTMGTEKIIVREGAELWVHLGWSDRAISPDIDLVSGSSLKNRDGHATLNGNIRFNIIDPEAETPSYDANGEVTLSMHWDKNNVLNGLLSGDGIVNLKAPSKGGTGSWKLTNDNNTFAGSYNLMDGGNGGMKLILGAQNAAQYATINLNGSSSVSTLELATSATIKALNSTDADNVVTASANSTLTVSEGSFAGKLQNGNGTLSLTKAGSGTLTLSGTVGASGAALGTITVNGGHLEVQNTSYTGAVTMSGGNLTYSGTGVTHTVNGGVATADGSQNSTFTVAEGSTLNVGSFDNGWGVAMVIDGDMVVSGATTFASNSTENISGTGSISTTSLAVANHSVYNVSTRELHIGTGGLSLGNPNGTWGAESGTLTLTSETTTVEGTTSISTSDSSLNFNSGSATLTGVVSNAGSINVNGGSATLSGGISGSGTVVLSGGALALGSGDGVTNEIAQFNYSGGTLAHSGLTVTNASFSGSTLDNSANTNGTLTLNGTLNVTSTEWLTQYGELTYTGGNVQGNGYESGSYLVVSGGTLSFGEAFALQVKGEAVTVDTSVTDKLIITGAFSDRYQVNVDETMTAPSTDTKYFVANDATLTFSDAISTLTADVIGTGTLAVTFDTTGGHGRNITATDFNGVVSISGSTGNGTGTSGNSSANVNLTNFTSLGQQASFKLVSGNHWSDDTQASPALISRDIELAGAAEDSFIFRHDDWLELSGKVTGTYLTTGRNYNNNNDNHMILSGEGSDIRNVKVTNSGTLTVNADMAFGTVNAPTLNIGSGSTLTVGLADASTASTVGSLSAAQGALSLRDNTLINLGGGTESAQKVHSIGSLTTAAGSGISLGDYATLELVSTQPGRFAGNNKGNSDSVSSLELAISGGTGSVLKLHMTTNTGWEYNNTVTLSTLTGATGGVGEVYIGSGSLANAVYNGNATTNLNGAALRMADGTGIVLRKANSGENLGAGDITLEGATELYNYGIDSTLTNNISGGTLNITNQGTVTLAGNVTLQALQMGIDTTLGDGVNERSYSLGSITNTASKKLTISRNATLKNLGSVTGTVTLAGSGVLDMGSSKSVNVSGLQSSTNWTGTVRISSSTTASGINLNTFGNGKSILELSGVADWLSNRRVDVNLLLKEHDTEPYGFKITGTDPSATYTFNGSISGDGDLIIGNSNEHSGNRTFTFNGDLSAWEGWLVLGLSNEHGANNPTVNLNYAGSADAAPTFFSGDDAGIRVNENHTGTLTVHIGNSTNTAVMNGAVTNLVNGTAQGQIDLNVVGSTDFNKDVVVTNMSVSEGQTATMNAGLTITGSVTNNGVLKLGSAATIEGGSMTNAQMSTAGIFTTATDGAKGTISNANVAIAQLAEGTSFSITDMVLTNTTVTAAAPTTGVSFSNVTVNGSFVLNVAAATSVTEPTVGAGGAESTTGTITYSYDLGLTSATAADNSITLNLDVLNAIAPSQSGQYTLVVELTNFDDSVFGSLDDATWKSLVGFQEGSWLAEAITPPTVESGDSTTTAPAVSYSYAAGTGSNVGTLTITITGLNVPEPTSATLGLAALMMLCARRRRRA